MEDGRMNFEDPKCIMDLAFLVDITQEINIFIQKLQELCHFTACKSFGEEDTAISVEEYAAAIESLQQGLMTTCLQTPSQLMNCAANGTY